MFPPTLVSRVGHTDLRGRECGFGSVQVELQVLGVLVGE
jgi:hypothetical protein